MILGANWTEDLLVARNKIVSSFFFLLDFSEMRGRIFMKFSGMVGIGLE